MEREAVAWNCSCVNALKGSVLHRTVPRHRLKGKPIRTYVERFHAEPFQVPCKRSQRVISINVNKGALSAMLLSWCGLFSRVQKVGVSPRQKIQKKRAPRFGIGCI